MVSQMQPSLICMWYTSYSSLRRGEPIRRTISAAHLGGSEEVADVVGGDVQRLEVEVDLFLLGQLSAGEQRVVHLAQLYGVGQVVVVVTTMPPSPSALEWMVTLAAPTFLAAAMDSFR